MQIGSKQASIQIAFSLLTVVVQGLCVVPLKARWLRLQPQYFTLNFSSRRSDIRIKMKISEAVFRIFFHILVAVRFTWQLQGF